jgi:D-aminopeptidase
MSDAETPAKTQTEQLDALFARWDRTDEPGMTVGVVKDGALIYRRGFGMASLETGVANTPKTRMRIGSITKHFTCLLALLLAEDGKLDIDAPVRAYIPELTGPGGDPTLRQLMQHRGGSRCYLDIGFIGHGMSVPPLGRALEVQIRQKNRNFAPGEAMIYNNGGYHLLSLAIERVGGAPLEAQLKARFFDVSGMPDTALIPTDHAIAPGIASMHMPGRDGGWRRGLFPSEEVRGEGGMVSTVDDMLRWTAHLRTRDRFGAPATWAQMTEPPHYADGSVGIYALGLMVDSYRGLATVHHSGGVMGGTAQMLTFPNDGLDVVILANGARDADVVRLARQVADVVLADGVGPETPTIPAEDFKAALGDYWSPENRMVYSLYDDAGVLKMCICNATVGAALVAGDDGWLTYPAGGLGEIAVKPEGEGLKVRFGPETLPFERLVEDDANAEVFASAAVGRYVGDDADTIAVIERDGEALAITQSDGLGRLRSRLVALSPTVAYARPHGPVAMLRTAISLEVKDGKATGFRLNTARTRNLEFHRTGDAG